MADAPADLEIRPLTPDDDAAAQLDLAERAFGPIPAAQREQRLLSLPAHMASGRNLGAFAGGQAAARGFPEAVSARVVLHIDDRTRPANSGLWDLAVAGGTGTLSPLKTLNPDAPANPTSTTDHTSTTNPASAIAPASTTDPADPARTAVTLGARGLAALYAGTPVAALRQAGLAAGGTSAGDAALDAAFAASPFMLDAF